MDDLISRQAAIDALHMHLMYRMGTDSNKKRLDEWINNLPSAQQERDTGYSDGFADGYIAGQKETQPEPQWIPCSERLPEEEGYYLTAHSYMSGHIGYHVTHFAKDLYKVDEYDFAEWKGVSGFFTIDDEYGYEKVDALAWMPIEPWRGEEHEDD